MTHHSDLRPPDPIVVAGLGAVVVGVSAAWFIAHPYTSGPIGGAALLSALWGLGHGVWFASWRAQRAAPGRRVTARVAPLLAYTVGAIVLAGLVEMGAGLVRWRISSGWRAGCIACLSALLAQLSWKRLFTNPESPT
jgi:hypothetical protein